MRKYVFSSTLAIVGAVSLLFAVAMLSKAWEPVPINGLDPGRYTKKQLGPSFDSAIRAMGDTPENCYEP